MGKLTGLLKVPVSLGSLLVTAIAGIFCLQLLSKAISQERLTNELLEQAYGKQVEVTKGVQAKLASTELERESYSGLLAAERKINGELVAALRIRIRARDTVIVHDTVPTDLQPDSTRVASVTDSTFAGVIKTVVRAPPCCAPLGITTSVRRPAFEPKIGFVQKAGRTIAVVDWQGEQYTIEDPYFTPRLAEQPPRITHFAEVLYDQTQALTFRGGTNVRAFWNLNAVLAVDQRVGDPARLQVGIRKVF